MLMSCKKDFLQSSNENSNPKTTIVLKKVVFLQNVIPDKLASYDEGACTVKVDTSMVPGTICFESVGKSCSSAHPCTPITSAAASGRFTKSQIDKKIDLIEKAYGIKYIY